MKLIKLSLFIAFVFFSSLFLTKIYAEDSISTEKANSSEAVLVATVNLQDAKIISQKDNIFKISFDISNREGIQVGVKYGVKLIQDTDQGQFLVDEKLYPENLSLSENSLLSKEITYEAPASLNGDYMLLVFSENQSGFPFGLLFIDNIKLESSVRGIEIFPETCFLTIDDGTEKYNLAQGVDVTQEENLILTCTAINSSSDDLSAIPSFKTTNRIYSTKINIPTEDKIDEIVFKGNDTTIFSVKIPKGFEPQAYDTKMTLKSGEVVSNDIIVHYVLSGVSATIKNLSLDKDYYKKGETALLSLSLTGRADNFPGSRASKENLDSNVSLSITIINSEGRECIKPRTEDVSQDITGSKIDVPLSIISNCLNPQVLITLINNDNGQILDQKEFNVETKSEVPNNILYLIISIILILIILIISFILVRKKNNNSNGVSLGVIIPFFALIAFGSLLMPSLVSADTFIIGDINGINAEVSVTGYKSYYSPGETIKLSGTISYSACDNTTSNIYLSARLSTSSTYKYLIQKNSVDGGTILSGFTTLKAPSVPGDYRIYVQAYANGKNATHTIYFSVSGDGICRSDHYRCSRGISVSGIDTDENYVWQCSGIGNGSSVDCLEAKTPIDGKCSATIDGCLSGVFADQPEDTSTEDKWSCLGINDGADASCSKTKPVSGSCGQTYRECLEGDLFSATTSLTEYNWSCKGSSSTPIAYCQEGRNVGGSCSTERPNECLSGTPADISQTSEEYLWSCFGINEGDNVSCSLPLDTTYGNLAADSCFINDGEGSCDISLSWEVFNPVIKNNSLMNKTTVLLGKYLSSGSLISTDDSGETTFNLPYTSSATVSLFNYQKRLNQKNVTARCVKGTKWDSTEGKCVGVLVNGQCNNTIINDCTIGDLEDLPDTDTDYKWSCNGLYEGTNDSCSKVISPDRIIPVCLENHYGCIYPSRSIYLKEYDTYWKWTCKSPTNKYITCTEINPNNPPTVPVINGPTLLSVDEEGIFTFTSIDPENEKIRYGVDWDLDGKVDTWIPGVINEGFTFVHSGTSQTAVNAWDKIGTYIFKVFAQDYSTKESGTSGWRTWSVKVNEGTGDGGDIIPLLGDDGENPPLITDPGNNGYNLGLLNVSLLAISVNSSISSGDSISISSGDSIQLQWSSVDGATCSIPDPNDSSNPIVSSGGLYQGVTNLFTPPKTTTYTIACVKGELTDTDTVKVIVNGFNPIFEEK